MCGFSGFISQSLPRELGLEILSAMADELQHRGPDGSGVWIAQDAEVGFAHRRLSVIDTGKGGHQPMLSRSGRFVLVFNGEIYNYKALKAEMQASGTCFETNSDTEVLLASLETWGVEKGLKKLTGMFAFALWDKSKKKLVLARDRFGEKPLYFGWQGRSFLFGSTINSLKKHRDWCGEIDRESVSLLSRLNYIPDPKSIYKDIKKLSPGTWLELSLRDGIWHEKIGIYWSALTAATIARNSPFQGTYKDALRSLEDTMRTILEGQMSSDVPLGAFLSGGIDSSAIVALLQSQVTRPVRTFTIGFKNEEYDESASAEAVAKHLGTEHTTCKLSEIDVLELISELPKMYDEPFADASQLPTALVSKITRKDVTVALSGDGGDEVFGGYNRYIWGPRIAKTFNLFPSFARKVIGSSLRSLPPTAWNRLFSFFLSSSRPRHIGDKLHKLGALCSSNDKEVLYRGMVEFWSDGLPCYSQQDIRQEAYADIWGADFEFVEQMMLSDTISYLPDDIMVKVDRAAMAFGLETRAPFLDHRLFELAWSLPVSYRFEGSRSKSLLRDLLYKYVPKEVVDRPKSGFALPIGDYLRGPLRDWSESLLTKERLEVEGYFDHKKVRNAWEQHLSGRYNRQYDLWSVLMFQNWLDA